MKIVILTQPLGHNYGGLLQAYALQKYLKQIGCDARTLDLRLKNGKAATVKKFIINMIRLFLGRIKFIPTKHRRAVVFTNLISFRDKYLKLSEQVTSNSQLKKYFRLHNFDIVIVGSDQVWRPIYSPNILNFYLDFLNDAGNSPQRIAYAASFGVSEWEYPIDVTERCKQLIKKFDAVSVRERSAVDLCRSNLGVTATWVADPTLLLNPSDYEEIVDRNPENAEKPSILSYILDSDENKQKISSKVSKILKAKLFEMIPERPITDVCLRDLGQHVYPKVEIWLRSFMDANFIITDSFHGTLFAILFNRPFIVVENPKRGMARFESLLLMFGLRHRLIKSSGEIDPHLISEAIDWEEVNRIREKFSYSSRLFLTGLLLKGKDDI